MRLKVIGLIFYFFFENSDFLISFSGILPAEFLAFTRAAGCVLLFSVSFIFCIKIFTNSAYEIYFFKNIFNIFRIHIKKFGASPSELESHWFKIFFHVNSGIAEPPIIFSNSFLEIDPSPFFCIDKKCFLKNCKFLLQGQIF